MGNTYEFGLDILNDVLVRAGEPTSGSEFSDQVKRYIWRGYIELLKAGPRLAAKKDPPGVISTVAKVTGTASVTEGSASVTLDATVAASMSGRKFVFDDENVPYRITAHTAGTAAVTLDATFKEDTKASAVYTIFQDEYDLATDCLIPWRFWFRGSLSRKLTFVTEDEMTSLHPTRIISTANGPVIKIGLISEKRVRIVPWTEDAETIEYSYTIEPTELDYTGAGAGDTPIVEHADRYIVADYAFMMLLFDKNDERFNGMVQILNAGVRGGENFKARSYKSRMRPRRGSSLGGSSRTNLRRY